MLGKARSASLVRAGGLDVSTMRTLSLSSFPVIALCVIPTAHADTLDQSNITLTSGELQAEVNEAYLYVAQTFTAGITGDLTRIQLDLVSQPIQGQIGEISPFSINVEILGVSNGIPTTNVLSSVVLAPGNYLLGTFIDFSQPAFVTAGEQYAIAVNYIGAPPIGPGSGQGHLRGNLGDAYSGGTPFGSVDGISWSTADTQTGGDIFLQTYLESTAVPEPAVSLLLCTGVAFVLLMRFMALVSQR
jgi:hypothetical protein